MFKNKYVFLYRLCLCLHVAVRSTPLEEIGRCQVVFSMLLKCFSRVFISCFCNFILALLRQMFLKETQNESAFISSGKNSRSAFFVDRNK